MGRCIGLTWSERMISTSDHDMDGVWKRVREETQCLCNNLWLGVAQPETCQHSNKLKYKKSRILY